MHSLIYHISETVSPAINYFTQQEKSCLTFYFFFFFLLQLRTLLLLLGHEFKFHPGWKWLNISISNSIFLDNNRTAGNVHFLRDICTWLSCSSQVDLSTMSVYCPRGTLEMGIQCSSSPWGVPGWSRADPEAKCHSPDGAVPLSWNNLFRSGGCGAFRAIPSFRNRPRLKNSSGVPCLGITKP